MKIAYVTPRYGTEVFGGAEHGARMLSERLVSMGGWEVDALTTCAKDSRTWANEYPAATVEINGVSVHRFASVAGRADQFETVSQRVLANPEAAGPDDEDRWIDLQGPLCPALVDAIAASDADLLVFYPYLYHPTVRGMPLVADRAVFQPAAHDEAPIRLPLFRRLFALPQAYVFHTAGERRVVEERFGTGAKRQIVLGLGVEEEQGDEAAARARLGLGDDPYLACIGRVDEGKGTTLLARYFAAYKERHPGPLRLVLAGSVVNRPPEHPDIIVPGLIDDATKWGLYRGAMAYVTPSPFESFSIVLMEAWTAGIPAIVNRVCAATYDHVRASGGGLWFDGFASFEAGLERLERDAPLRATLGAAGAGYVEANFSWPVLIDRYTRFLEAVAEHRPGS